MAQMHKIEEKFELQCSAEKIFETMRAKLPKIPEHCSDKIPSIEVQEGGWVSVGSTRKWDMNIGGKSTYVIERFDEIDEEKMILTRSIIEGEMMRHYKSLKATMQVISKGDDNKSCLVIGTLDYEKVEDDSPEPKEFLSFGVGVLKQLAHHLAASA